MDPEQPTEQFEGRNNPPHPEQPGETVGETFTPPDPEQLAERAEGTTTPPKKEPKVIPKHTPTHTRPNNYTVEAAVPTARKRSDVAYYTRGRYYGPMPLHLFFEKFMPYNNTNIRRNAPSKIRCDTMKKMAFSGNTEPKMYEFFIEALKNWPPKENHVQQIKLTYRDTHEWGDPNCGGLAVDVAVADRSMQRAWKDLNHIPFAEQETHVEFKPAASHDPFIWNKEQVKTRPPPKAKAKEKEADEEDKEQEGETDGEDGVGDGYLPEKPLASVKVKVDDDDMAGAVVADRRWEDYAFENPSLRGISCRGQIAYYAAAAMTVQYRSHFFQLVIFGKFARFLRWDRSGAIVSQRLDYSSEPDPIFDFYRRLAQLLPAQRGLDPQITRSREEEVEFARECFTRFFPDGWHGRPELPRKIERPFESQGFLTLTTEDGQKYVICVPVFFPDSYTPFGRCTRRSLAYPLSTPIVEGEKKQPFFMKHFFSQNYPTTLKESEVYDRIAKRKKAGERVPRGFCDMAFGGDVAGTETVAHLYCKEDWIFGRVQRPPQLVGHRIVLKQTGTSIRYFPNFKTLLNCVADAMEAHTWLFRELRILHRDISPGNMLMTRNVGPRAGYLIDFDNALDLERKDASLSPGRTGTLQFMAAMLLQEEEHEQDDVDDRESGFHSIVYLCMLYAKHKYSNSPELLYDRLQSLFQTRDGASKRSAFVDNAYSTFGWCEGLAAAIEELEEAFKWRYIKIKESAVEKQATEKDRKRAAARRLMDLEDRNIAVERLGDGDWFVGVLRRHAEDMDVKEKEWVENYYNEWGATPAGITSTQTLGTRNRRGLDGDLGFDEQAPPAKRQRKNHNSS